MNGAILFGWFLTIGWLPMNVEKLSLLEDSMTARTGGSMVQTIGLEATVRNRMRIWTEIETREFAEGPLYYKPFRSGYRTGVEVFGETWALGVWHECVHPVVSDDNIEERAFYSATTEFYLTIHGGSLGKSKKP